MPSLRMVARRLRDTIQHTGGGFLRAGRPHHLDGNLCMTWITSNTLRSIGGKSVLIAPRRVRYLAAFLAVALLTLCAFYPSSPALAQPFTLSERSLGSGASKTSQPSAVSAAVRPTHRLIFIGDSLTAGFF